MGKKNCSKYYFVINRVTVALAKGGLLFFECPKMCYICLSIIIIIEWKYLFDGYQFEL